MALSYATHLKWFIRNQLIHSICHLVFWLLFLSLNSVTYQMSCLFKLIIYPDPMQTKFKRIFYCAKNYAIMVFCCSINTNLRLRSYAWLRWWIRIDDIRILRWHPVFSLEIAYNIIIKKFSCFRACNGCFTQKQS